MDDFDGFDDFGESSAHLFDIEGFLRISDTITHAHYSNISFETLISGLAVSDDLYDFTAAIQASSHLARIVQKSKKE